MLMSANKTPCKGCEKRHPACHDNCEVYKEWTAARKEVQAKLKQWKSETFADRMSDTSLLKNETRERKHRKYDTL